MGSLGVRRRSFDRNGLFYLSHFHWGKKQAIFQSVFFFGDLSPDSRICQTISATMLVSLGKFTIGGRAQRHFHCSSIVPKKMRPPIALSPKVPRPFLCQTLLTTAISKIKSKKNFDGIFFPYIIVGSCSRLVRKCVEKVSHRLQV